MHFDKPINPTKDSSHLARYYRAFLQQHSGNARIQFDGIASDAEVAAEILDLLEDSGRKNKEFINAWLEYFYDEKLKGGKVYDSKYTSMREWRYSFERFNERFYIPQ